MKKGIGEWYNLKLGIKDHQDLIKNQIQGAWTREAEKGEKKSRKEKGQLWNKIYINWYLTDLYVYIPVWVKPLLFERYNVTGWNSYHFTFVWTFFPGIWTA